MGALISVGVIGNLIWSFFNPVLAAKVFIILVGLFEGYIILMSRIGRPDNLGAFNPPYYLNPDEVAVVKRYHLFFRFPFASRELSAALSGIQLSSLVWVPWLLYQQEWLAAIALALNFFIAATLAMQLNPRLFLSRASGVTALTASMELMSIQSALRKFVGHTRGEDFNPASP